jgi:2-C-methyl-D-erythritol 2,4-cyclodiphosphate synthase
MKTAKHPAKREADIEESQGRQATHARSDNSSPWESRHLRPNLLTSVRTGFGNDLHRLVVGRKLVLGGVRIAFAKGPAGHSDGDALAHAICDALLGAAGLGDIGRHFPNTSPKWRAVSSLIFLRRVRDMLRGAGYAIANVDSTVGLERPRLSPYIPRMREKLAQALGLNADQVSVKAKTGEGVDAVGRGEAVRADAVALICKLVEKSRDESQESKVKKSKRQVG